MSEEELREAIEKYKSLTNSEKIWIVDKHFFEEHDKQIRAEERAKIIDMLNSVCYDTHNDETRRIEHRVKAEIIELIKNQKAEVIDEKEKKQEALLAMARHHENINKQIAEEFSKADMESFMEYVKEHK